MNQHLAGLIETLFCCGLFFAGRAMRTRAKQISLAWPSWSPSATSWTERYFRFAGGFFMVMGLFGLPIALLMLVGALRPR